MKASIVRQLGLFSSGGKKLIEGRLPKYSRDVDGKLEPLTFRSFPAQPSSSPFSFPSYSLYFYGPLLVPLISQHTSSCLRSPTPTTMLTGSGIKVFAGKLFAHGPNTSSSPRSNFNEQGPATLSWQRSLHDGTFATLLLVATASELFDSSCSALVSLWARPK
jgi:hypothetical protein